MTRVADPHRSGSSLASQWLLREALPFWIARGLGADGLAHEELTFEGLPKELGYRRSLVQFRQVYVLAHAALLGHAEADSARGLFQRVAPRAWHPDGGFVHRLTGEGLTPDPMRDAYDQAFGLLAAAWVYALDNSDETLSYAYRTLAFLDTQLSSPAGGYVEALPPRMPRRQNPHMHLFEAFLALYEVTGDAVFLQRADAIFALVEQRFVTSSGALREYFDEAWQPAHGRDGEIVEPGHHYEWVWLLHEHARVARRPLHPLADSLFVFATRHGLDPEGLPIEQIDTAGRPLKSSLKLWAVSEQLKAHVVRAEAAGRRSDDVIDSITQALVTKFLLRSPAPVWFEEIAADGTPSRRRMPASTLYHLHLAFAELMRWREGRSSPLQRGGAGA